MSYRVFFLEFISGDFTVDLGGPGLQRSQVQLPLALYDTAELPLQPSVTEDKCTVSFNQQCGIMSII